MFCAKFVAISLILKFVIVTTATTIGENHASFEGGVIIPTRKVSSTRTHVGLQLTDGCKKKSPINLFHAHTLKWIHLRVISNRFFSSILYRIMVKYSMVCYLLKLISDTIISQPCKFQKLI